MDYPAPEPDTTHGEECGVHRCPECRDGKHKNCTGDAWCNYGDELTTCDCERNHTTEKGRNQ